MLKSELNRSVWNGNAAQRASAEAGTATFSKILLKEIGNTSVRTKDVFEVSITGVEGGGVLAWATSDGTEATTVRCKKQK